MSLLREIVSAFFLLATCYGASKQFNEKASPSLKRTVETYSYPVPTDRSDNQQNVKSKVIVETIKSISPSEYLSSIGYLGSTFEASSGNEKVSLGTVTYNAFEPDTVKKASTINFTETSVPTKRKSVSSYKYYTSSISSSSQKPVNTPIQTSSTIPPAPVRTTSVEPATTLLPNYLYSSHSSSFPQPSASGEATGTEKPLKIITTKGKPGTGRYTVQKIIKKSTKIESKLSDSKPEETGFNGYHYDVGALNFESKHSGSQGGGGMMGASYMRSSSPFYNYHVMLD